LPAGARICIRASLMAWSINLHEEVRDWYAQLPTEEFGHVEGMLDMLREQGPALGRPLVDTIRDSRHQNMKELRRGTTRILFAFDPKREAILLVVGDKRGDWNRWYDTAVPIADERYDEWLDNLE
jgi:hypothetical protein